MPSAATRGIGGSGRWLSSPAIVHVTHGTPVASPKNSSGRSYRATSGSRWGTELRAAGAGEVGRVVA